MQLHGQLVPPSADGSQQTPDTDYPQDAKANIGFTDKGRGNGHSLSADGFLHADFQAFRLGWPKRPGNGLCHGNKGKVPSKIIKLIRKNGHQA